MPSVSKLGTEVITTRYATLEDSDNFQVAIFQVGKRFKLKYADTRDAFVSRHTIFTKWWDTKGAADEYIKLYKQMKGVSTDDSHRQRKSGQRRQGK